MLLPKPFIIDKQNREHKLAHANHGIQLHDLKNGANGGDSKALLD